MRNRYFVYIVTNYTRTTLYIGVTNDLERRIWEHKNKECEGFMEKYNCDRLVYFEETNDITTAIQREKNIKKWKREWKENIIKEMNPKWADLANDWFDTQDPRDTPEDDSAQVNKKIIHRVLRAQEETPSGVIFPNQTHSTRIVEIITGQEDLTECDGVWTRDSQFILGIQTADCAPICFWDDEKFGIIHAGWRGLCDGIIENMLEIFKKNERSRVQGPQNPGSTQPNTELTSSNSRVRFQNKFKIFVGPILPQFEIQKDFCYKKIEQKFDTAFFNKKEQKIYFDFQKALASVLPSHTEWDGRSTFENKQLASWRRDRTQARNKTIIGVKIRNKKGKSQDRS